MKKLLFIAILIATVTVYGQAPRGWYVVAGANQTELKSSDALADPAMGYKVGLCFNMGYHESYNYQVELLYNHSSLNFKTLSDDYLTANDTKYSSSSLDIGVYFNYYILRPDQDKFFLGPQIGLTTAVGGQLTPADGGGNKRILPYLLDENDFSDGSKVNFDAGIGLTGGYNDFRFDLRYLKGLNNRLSGAETDSYNENNTYTGRSLTGKTNSISFTVSYIFWKRIKKRK